MIDKPKYGTPCNNCGHCCRNSLCPLATHVFRRPDHPGPCPALELDGEKGVCGLVKNPEKYVPMRAVLAAGGAKVMSETALLGIGSGRGCDAFLDGFDEPDPEFAARMRADGRALRNTPEGRLLYKVWGIKNG